MLHLILKGSKVGGGGKSQRDFGLWALWVEHTEAVWLRELRRGCCSSLNYTQEKCWRMLLCCFGFQTTWLFTLMLFKWTTSVVLLVCSQLGSCCAKLLRVSCSFLPVFMKDWVTPVSCSFLWCKVRVSCHGCSRVPRGTWSCHGVISQHRALSSFLSCTSTCHIVQEGSFVHCKQCL